MSFTSEAYKSAMEVMKRSDEDIVIKRVGGGKATERDKKFLGRALTTEKPHTYDEIYQAYKREWLKRGDRTEHPIYMPPPADFLYTKVKELDIAYDEMLKYLDYTCDVSANARHTAITFSK